MQEPISNSDTPTRRARRSYTKEFKAQLVAECRHGEKSIAQVAMEHQINANLIHKWSRQLEGSPTQAMVPVRLTASPTVMEPAAGIEVTVGQATVHFHGAVDATNARVVLDLLR